MRAGTNNDEQKKSIICPIHKKGDKLICESHRRIALLCEVLTDTIYFRLEPNTENIIGEYQAGFRKGRSTIQQLFTVKQMLQKCWENNIKVYQIFVDFKQIYDSINHEKLYKITNDARTPCKLIMLVRATRIIGLNKE